jgi:hypothetical protein
MALTTPYEVTSYRRATQAKGEAVTRRWLLIPALLALAAALYATASTAASPAWTTERYYTHETWHAFADIGKKDNGGPDDIYAAQQALENTDGASVGVINGYGVNLRPPYVFFHWTATLTAGTLTLESAINLRNKTATYPIAGGSGRYTGARGTVTLTDAGNKGTLATVHYQRSQP